MNPTAPALLWLFLLLSVCSLSHAQDRALRRAQTSCASVAVSPRMALVIGNATYAHAPLKNAVNDAVAVSKALKALNFTVLQAHNLHREAMETLIECFAAKLQKGGVGFFYYAGHGMQVKGQNYLIPLHSRIHQEFQVPHRAVNANEALSALEASGSSVNIVVLDACRNNPFASAFRSAGRGLADMSRAPIGSFIAFAAQPGQVASDGDGDNGLFTEQLIKHIRTKNLTIDQVFNLVSEGVVKKTRGKQVPWRHSSLTGNVYLSTQVAKPQRVQPPVTTSAPTQSQLDLVFWQSIEKTPSLAMYQAYLAQYPRGQFAAIARLRIAALKQQKTPVIPAPVVVQPRIPVQPKPKAKPKPRRQTPQVMPLPPKVPVQRTLPASANVGESWTEGTTGITLVKVGGACFTMGCGHWVSDCGAQYHTFEACVDDFWISRFEVTQRQWSKLMAENPSRYPRFDTPVHALTVQQAQAFTQAFTRVTGLAARLPTETEWEYACRSGGKLETWAGGHETSYEDEDEMSVFGITNENMEVTTVAWFGARGGNRPHTPGSKEANGLGLFDMTGNVWEWVTMESGESTVRGSGWNSHLSKVSCAYRPAAVLNEPAETFGFRLVIEQ